MFSIAHIFVFAEMSLRSPIWLKKRSHRSRCHVENGFQFVPFWTRRNQCWATGHVNIHWDMKGAANDATTFVVKQNVTSTRHYFPNFFEWVHLGCVSLLVTYFKCQKDGTRPSQKGLEPRSRVRFGR